MWRLAPAFVEIALHRRGPDSLPASQFLLVMLLSVYFLVGLLVLSSSGSLDSASLGFFVVDSGLYLGYVWLLLSFYRQQSRFMQTASALLGADTLFNLLGIPLLAWSRALQTAEADTAIPTLLFVLLFFWSIDVAGFVVSRALARPYVTGVLVVIPYVMASIIARDALSQVPG